MNELQTDRRILRVLFEMYRNDYPDKGDPFVQIDPHAVAKRLGCSPQLLFGRLHYDMGTRLRHRDPRNPNVTLASVYERVVADRQHFINFPYVVALLSGMEAENRKHWVAITLSIFAVCVSIAGILVRRA